MVAVLQMVNKKDGRDFTEQVCSLDVCNPNNLAGSPDQA